MRSCLRLQGFSLSRRRANGENGAGIIASKESISIHIEVIGYKRTGPARSKDFYEAVFRALSRIKDGAKMVAVACPVEFQIGLPQRTAIYGCAWTRLGIAFPELQLWFVYPDQQWIDRGHWNYWFETANREYLVRVGEVVE